VKLKKDGTPSKTTIGELKYKYDAGDILTNKHGDRYKFIKRTNNKVWVEFLDHRKYCLANPVSSSSAVSGNLKDWYAPTVCGWGYCGFPPETDSLVYYAWRGVVSRVKTGRRDTYRCGEISELFRCYQDFYYWYRKEELIKDYPYQVDKDLFSISEHPIYSEDTCCLLPRDVNMAIQDKTRKKKVFKTSKGYHLANNTTNAWVFPDEIYYFETPEECIEFYNFVKKDELLKLIEEYKDVLQPHVILRLKDYEFDYKYEIVVTEK